MLVIGCGALGQFGVKILRILTGTEIIAVELERYFGFRALLLFRGDCPSVATPQSQVGIIIPTALVL